MYTCPSRKAVRHVANMTSDPNKELGKPINVARANLDNSSVSVVQTRLFRKTIHLIVK